MFTDLPHHSTSSFAYGGFVLWQIMDCSKLFQPSIRGLHFYPIGVFRPIVVDRELLTDICFLAPSWELHLLCTTPFSSSPYAHVNWVIWPLMTSQGKLYPVMVHQMIHRQPWISEGSPVKNMLFSLYINMIYPNTFRIAIGNLACHAAFPIGIGFSILRFGISFD